MTALTDPSHQRGVGGFRNRATAQPPLASEPHILDCFSVAVRNAGLVGLDQAAKLLYLVLVSRLLPRPVSAVVKALSAAGKSFLVETVLRFFPPEAFHSLSGMSERALIYSEESLVHRMLVIYEAAGVADEGFAPYFLRSLLSEGHLRYETVETGNGKPKGLVLEREGPTGVILTTTRVRLDPDLETRLISIPVTDSAAQTKAVMYALAEESGEAEVGGEWLALQRQLADNTQGVTIPYARALAEAIPPAATRLRRDFGVVLGLIKAHALLHRATRERNSEGLIIATVHDYAVVRELVADLISEGVGRTVSPETRETVQAVERLSLNSKDGVRQTELAGQLQLDKGTISRRVRKALDGGYLRNLEEHRGRPHRLVTGDPLPEEQVILPEPEELHGCAVAKGGDPPPKRYLPQEGGPKRAKRANGSSKPKTLHSQPAPAPSVARIGNRQKPLQQADGAGGADRTPVPGRRSLTAAEEIFGPVSNEQPLEADEEAGLFDGIPTDPNVPLSTRAEEAELARLRAKFGEQA